MNQLEETTFDFNKFKIKDKDLTLNIINNKIIEIKKYLIDKLPIEYKEFMLREYKFKKPILVDDFISEFKINLNNYWYYKERSKNPLMISSIQLIYSSYDNTLSIMPEKGKYESFCELRGIDEELEKDNYKYKGMIFSKWDEIINKI